MKTQLPPELRTLLAPLIDAIVDAVAERLRSQSLAPESPWLDAKTSQLGVRAFRAAARAGEFETFKVGRKYLARRSDVDGFVERQRVDIEANRNEAARDPFERALVRKAAR